MKYIFLMLSVFSYSAFGNPDINPPAHTETMLSDTSSIEGSAVESVSFPKYFMLTTKDGKRAVIGSCSQEDAETINCEYKTIILFKLKNGKCELTTFFNYESFQRDGLYWKARPGNLGMCATPSSWFMIGNRKGAITPFAMIHRETYTDILFCDKEPVYDVLFDNVGNELDVKGCKTLAVL